LNLGNPEALDWLINHIDKLITENGIDLYRQDFNIDPLQYWRDNDAQDRQGITEIKYVTGYLAYLDELLRRHPNMLIDTCASGGRRLDLETVRRCVPLWRSDYAFEPIGHQCQTYGLSFWLPFHGTGTVAYVDAPYYGGGVSPVQPYAFWSNSGISLVFGLDMRVKELDYDTLRRLVRQWRSISADYYGDFYPLTPYSLEKDVWIAWQFHRPEIGQGMVQAFRRPESTSARGRFKLRGLLPDGRYEVTNLDLPGKLRMTGRELMEAGVEIAIEDRPGAAVVTYLKVE
jgi:alpha-galactosidase